MFKYNIICGLYDQPGLVSTVRYYNIVGYCPFPPTPWLGRWSPGIRWGDEHLIVGRLSTVPVMEWGLVHWAALNDNTRTDRPNTATEVCVDGARGCISREAHVRPRVPLWSFKSAVLVALEGTDHLALRPFRRAPSSRLLLTYRTSGSWVGWWFMRIHPNCCFQPGLSLNQTERMEDIYTTQYHIHHITYVPWVDWEGGGGGALPVMDGWILSVNVLVGCIWWNRRELKMLLSFHRT